MLQNLLHNAIKFVPPKRRPRIRITGQRNQSEYIVKIHDNGIGIPKQFAQQIFQPFNRLHGVEAYPGVGLGLAVVKRAMEIMGGDVGVHSQRGKGSEFWLKFKRRP
ncbi:MAG: sensor histidine kinase [candidate division KSB1 bacterium]|nr:sensor histidine kinase [candidate division KSB1 bacterium]